MHSSSQPAGGDLQMLYRCVREYGHRLSWSVSTARRVYGPSCQCKSYWIWHEVDFGPRCSSSHEAATFSLCRFTPADKRCRKLLDFLFMTSAVHFLSRRMKNRVHYVTLGHFGFRKLSRISSLTNDLWATRHWVGAVVTAIFYAIYTPERSRLWYYCVAGNITALFHSWLCFHSQEWNKAFPKLIKVKFQPT